MKKWTAWVDICVGILLVLGWIGKVHPPDSRKVALGVLLFVTLVSQAFRKRSYWLRLGRNCIALLATNRKIRWSALLGIFLLAQLFVVGKALALRYSAFDVGIFQQLLWSLSHGEQFHSSMSRAGNFLLDHFPPSLYLLAPLHRILGGWAGLPGVFSVFLLFGGGLAWIWLAERMPGTHSMKRGWMASIAAIGLIFTQSLWGNWEWGFHETHIGFFFWSWGTVSLILYGKKSWGLALSLTLLIFAAGAKETFLIYIGFFLLLIGIFQPVRLPHRSWIYRGICMALGVGLLVAFLEYSSMPKHAEKNYVAGYFGYLGKDTREVISTLLTRPFVVFQVVGVKKAIEYLLSIFGLVGFLPLARSGRNTFVLTLGLLPPLFLALISEYPNLRNMNMHYVLEPLGLLGVLAVLSLARKNRSYRWGYAWCFMALFFFRASPLNALWYDYREIPKTASIRQYLSQIPEDLVVMADHTAGPYIADRLWAVTWWRSLEGLDARCPHLFIMSVPNESDLPRREQEMADLLAQCKLDSTPQMTLEKETPPEEGGWKVWKRNE